MVNIWVQGSDILGLTHLMIVDLGPKKKKKTQSMYWLSQNHYNYEKKDPTFNDFLDNVICEREACWKKLTAIK